MGKHLTANILQTPLQLLQALWQRKCESLTAANDIPLPVNEAHTHTHTCTARLTHEFSADILRQAVHLIWKKLGEMQGHNTRTNACKRDIWYSFVVKLPKFGIYNAVEMKVKKYKWK